jgi:hypothetical protein
MRHGVSEQPLETVYRNCATRIDCDLAVTGEQREAIFRLRYPLIREDPYSKSCGSLGRTGQWLSIGLYVDGELASSIPFV